MSEKTLEGNTEFIFYVLVNAEKQLLRECFSV